MEQEPENFNPGSFLQTLNKQFLESQEIVGSLDEDELQDDGQKSNLESIKC